MIISKIFEEGGMLVSHAVSWETKNPGNFWFTKQKKLKKNYPIYYNNEIVSETVSCKQINSTKTIRIVFDDLPQLNLTKKFIGLSLNLNSVICTHCLNKANSIDELCKCLKGNACFKSYDYLINGFVIYDKIEDIDYYKFLLKTPIDFIILNPNN